MPTDKNPHISIRDYEVLHTIDDLLDAAISEQKDLLEDLEAVRNAPLSHDYNRRKAALAVKAIGNLRKSIEDHAHLVVEIASEYGVPQRVMAEHIGVAPATVLKWIRNPLGCPEGEYEDIKRALIERGERVRRGRLAEQGERVRRGRLAEQGERVRRGRLAEQEERVRRGRLAEQVNEK